MYLHFEVSLLGWIIQNILRQVKATVVAVIYALCMKPLKPGIHLNIKKVCFTSQRILSFIIKNGL